MKKSLTALNHAFASGALGALAASLLLWFVDQSRFDRALGVSIHHSFSLEWYYPRIFWGGILGLLLLLPGVKMTGWKKGLLLSLAPTTVEFFVSLPAAGAGNLGLKWGLGMPLMVLGVNAAGCVFAVFWGKKTGEL